MDPVDDGMRWVLAVIAKAGSAPASSTAGGPGVIPGWPYTAADSQVRVGKPVTVWISRPIRERSGQSFGSDQCARHDGVAVRKPAKQQSQRRNIPIIPQSHAIPALTVPAFQDQTQVLPFGLHREVRVPLCPVVMCPHG